MTVATAPIALGEFRALVDVVPSPLNPRRNFDKTRLDELAESVKSKGVLQALIVRDRAGLAQLEIVDGERRYRAAKLAGLKEIPVVIRHLTDVEVLELMAIANSQRDDLHPLEEADNFKALMKADRAYTPKAIGAKIGKSERYVQQRLQLTRLEADVQKRFLANEITAGHADLLSRLTPEDQLAGLKICFHHLFGDDQERGCISVRTLNTWIDGNIRLQLTKEDPQTEFFPELEKVVDEGATILQVAGSYLPEAVTKKLGAIAMSDYKRVDGKKDRCPVTKRAVIVIGTGRGTFVEICTAKTACKKHWRFAIEEAERQKKERERASKGQKTSKPSKASVAARQRHVAAEVLRDRRRTAIARAVTQIEKGKSIKPGPPVLALLQRAGFGRDWNGVVAALLRQHLGASDDQGWKQAVNTCSAFGVKLDAIERELLGKAKAQASAPKLKKKTKAAA